MVFFGQKYLVQDLLLKRRPDKDLDVKEEEILKLNYFQDQVWEPGLERVDYQLCLEENARKNSRMFN